ncbi:MAG: hypothetical protein H6573_25915 [Lewinellaceae bacterium]|nr:hypothetical protein [Phaeodactylibacter sp.]MCB9350913.1 hypothetical protein [Lewinellaceae bacterium]
MNKVYRYLRARCLPLFFLFLPVFLVAQGPISGFMPGRGITDVALGYSTESFSSYLFGDEKQESRLTTESINLFIEHGFTDTLSLVVNVPYLWIDPENRGPQDAGLYVKYRNQYKKYTSGYLNLITSIGLSFPISGYPKDTDTPIGQRAINFQGRFQGQYVSDFGVFFQLQSGVDFQFLEELLPAVPILFRTGYGARRYFVEAWIESYNTLNGGVDTQIAGGAGSQWLRIGGSLYLPLSSNFGIVFGGARILTGRNIGLSTRWNAGVVYRWDRRRGE